MNNFGDLCDINACASTIESVCHAPKPNPTNCKECAADLKALCPNDIGKGQQCFQCVEKNAGDLMKKGCNLRDDECEKALHQACGGKPDNAKCGACDTDFNQYCGGKSGADCLDCMGEHISQLMRGKCNFRQCGKHIEKKCNADDIPDEGSCADCVADIHQYCASDSTNRTTIHECEKCVADHVGDFIYHKCDLREHDCARAIYHTCTHHHPHPHPQPKGCDGCEKDFKKSCADTEGKMEPCMECIEKHYQQWNKDGSCNVQQCLPDLNKMCS